MIKSYILICDPLLKFFSFGSLMSVWCIFFPSFFYYLLPSFGLDLYCFLRDNLKNAFTDLPSYFLPASFPAQTNIHKNHKPEKDYSWSISSALSALSFLYFYVCASTILHYFLLIGCATCPFLSETLFMQSLSLRVCPFLHVHLSKWFKLRFRSYLVLEVSLQGRIISFFHLFLSSALRYFT